MGADIPASVKNRLQKLDERPKLTSHASVSGATALIDKMQIPAPDRQNHGDIMYPQLLKPGDVMSNKSKATSDDNCDSDNSSVSSEHSNKSTKTFKRVRKGWKTCPVHSKGPKHSKEKRAAKREEQRRQREATIAALNIPASSVISVKKEPSKSETDQEGSSELPCTCKIVTKERSKPRPEPEGGQSNTNFLDEYDRIIYGTEPIFSDMEENEAMDQQIRMEMERYHKRSSVVNADIFASATLVTSNTLMKFAIIQAELKNLMHIALQRVCDVG